MLTKSKRAMAEKQGTWGGARDGAGAKSKWQSEGGTKLVRIPVAIESQVLEAARVIDAGVRLISADLAQETVTKSSYDEIVTQSNHRIQNLERQLDQVQQERDRLQLMLTASQSHQQCQQPDLESNRDRYLQSLRLGKQAPEYKRVKKILDSFVAFVQSL